MTTLAAAAQETQAPSRITDGRILRWLIAAALLGGFCYLASPAHEFEDGFSEEEHIARHLVHGQGYLSPFDNGADALPTSWCPPVYPWIIAIAYRIFGEQTTRAVSAVILFNVFCRAGCAAALFVLGWQIFDRYVGALAGGLLLLHPMFLHVVDSVWDNYLALAMFLWLLCWAMRLRRQTHIKPSQIGLMGAVLGVLLLTNTSYVLACPAIVLLAVAGQSWRRKALLGIVAAAAMCLVLLPWTIRNERCFGRLMLVRGNANTELWLANQPFSYGWMTLPVLDSHPSRNEAEHRLLMEIGETNYFAECGRRFAVEYHANPVRFWFLCGERFIHVFITDTGRSGAYFWLDINIDRYLINGAIATAGLAGAWTMWRLRQRGNVLLGIALLAVAPYLITQVYNRYALPLRAILVLFAAFLLMKLARWKTEFTTAEPAKRLSSANRTGQ